MSILTQNIPLWARILVHRTRHLACLGACCFAIAAPAAEEKEEAPFTVNDLTPEMRASITKAPPDREIPYKPGMQLTYKIGWGWFNVGSAVLTVEEADLGGEDCLKFTLVARTNSFADSIYKVRNTTTSWVDRNMTRTIHYTNDQNEGKRERQVVMPINTEDNTVQYHNLINNEIHEPIAIIDGTWDPMAITFFVGTLQLSPGTQLVIPTTNGREFFLTYVVAKEVVERRFSIGKRKAILLEPDIKDLGGVFSRSDDSAVRFWFAAEGPQVPLRMESEVAVGSFWAELVSIEGADQ